VHNLRLVIKNTGHDLLGRSSAPESLQIWTHKLKDMTFIDNFLPEGLDGGMNGYGPAVTIGAGVQLRELYETVGAKGLLVATGLANTVGAAGGHIQGGGHSPLGTWKGMASDNALEFKVVTSSVGLA
jgi:FAD/FMN-containing dehydrogenase